MLKAGHKLLFTLLFSAFLLLGTDALWAQFPSNQVPDGFPTAADYQAQGFKTDAFGKPIDQFGNQLALDAFGNPVDAFGNPIDAVSLEQQVDTVPKRERKPLESWFFDNQMRARSNFAWSVDTRTNNVHEQVIDTLLTDFEVDFPFLKKGVGDAYLGQLGGASVPLDYHLRPKFRDFSFGQPYYVYLFTPENAPHYNVKLPYTNLGYGTAGQRRVREEHLTVIHAQNIAPSIGFNVTYHNQGTRGIYQNQRTKNKDLSLGAYYTGKRYSVHAGYINNDLYMRDNGGLARDQDITNINVESTLNLDTRLKDARNLVKSNTAYLVQAFGVPLRRLTDDDFSMAQVPAFYVGHAFEYSRWNREYTDTRNNTKWTETVTENGSSQNVTREYFENWFIDPNTTRDSLFESKLSNRLFIQLQPWDRDGIVGTVDAGVGMDMHQYRQFSLHDYTTGRITPVKETSYYVYGSVEGKFRRYLDWGAKAQLVPIGYRNGDLEAEANAALTFYLKQHPVSLSGKIGYSRTSPDYWSQTFFSNHYVWSNSFSKENESRLQVSLNIPSTGTEVGFNQSILTNKVYYGADYLPAQAGSAVSVTGLYIRQDFRFGGFHLNNRVLLQWSTDQTVVPVPLFSAYLSYFFQFNVVKDVLVMKVGVDGRYNSNYYAPGFNPAIGQFYNQREKEIGDYPMLDAFITAKWKRLRIMLKVEHLNENWFSGYQDYFQVLHYPLNKRVFKIALSWSFYD